MRRKKANILLTVVLLGVFILAAGAMALEPLKAVTDSDRCAVCGMFVAKYPAWVVQAKMSDGSIVMFDGPKDMFAYIFSPQDFSGQKDATPVTIVVKDYYSQQWIEGMQASYVVGSDVLGPMGHEFVPFIEQKAAENFVKDHGGKKILSYPEVTPTLVQSMRKGHKMKKQMKK